MPPRIPQPGRFAMIRPPNRAGPSRQTLEKERGDHDNEPHPVDAEKPPEGLNMRVTLDYGRTGMPVELPDAHVVGPLEIRPAAPLPDPEGAIAAALRRPTG